MREDEVLVELKIMLEDLVLFHGLKANAQTIFNADDLRKAAEKHEKFLLKHFAIRDGDGRLLKGKMDQRNADAITDDGVPQIELMKRTVVYLMHFTPAKKNPKFLTFTQMFGGEKSIIPSIMDFMVLQSGVWTDKPVQLQPGRPHTIAHGKLEVTMHPPCAAKCLSQLQAAEAKASGRDGGEQCTQSTGS